YVFGPEMCGSTESRLHGRPCQNKSGMWDLTFPGFRPRLRFSSKRKVMASNYVYLDKSAPPHAPNAQLVGVTGRRGVSGKGYSGVSAASGSPSSPGGSGRQGKASVGARKLFVTLVLRPATHPARDLLDRSEISIPYEGRRHWT